MSEILDVMRTNVKLFLYYIFAAKYDELICVGRKSNSYVCGLCLICSAERASHVVVSSSKKKSSASQLSQFWLVMFLSSLISLGILKAF